MKPFKARWTVVPGDEARRVIVIGFTEGDAVVLLPDGTLDRARLRDLRAVEPYEDWLGLANR